MTPFKPTIEQIKALKLDKRFKDCNMIAIYADFTADIDTPVSAFLKLREGSNKSFLLESVSLGENISRYSFIGINPIQTISTGPGESFQGDPLSNLEQELKKFRIIPTPELNLPLTGGAIGYCSFDAVQYFEPKVAPYIQAQKDVLRIPESVYMIYDTIVVFDHAFHTLKIVSHVSLDSCNLEKAYQLGKDKIQRVCKRLSSPISLNGGASIRPVEIESHGCDFKIDWNETSNVGKEGYMDFVKQLKHHIEEGDIFQAVPSQRLSIPLPEKISSFDLYRQMRMINPSPYMYYLELNPDFQILGASPEMLVKVDHNRQVETHPIAGTRKRGKTIQEDDALAKDLLLDKKECAEHIMLVDLGRNDVGRVSIPGSVNVEQLMHIERYSHVMHIVSIVKGQLREDQTIFDAYRSLFPAGTVSGAPKVKAMELICSLEKERRGIYAGSVGYFSFTGQLDTAIAIRTIVVKDGIIYCQAGGGIVYDSDPLDEYQETVNKLGSAVRTIEKMIQSNQKALEN